MRALSLLFFLPLFACGNAGTVSLGDKLDTGITGDDTGASGDDTADTGEPQDTEPQANAWSGDYAGFVTIFIEEWDYDFCEGELDIEVDDEGVMEGSGLCASNSQWGGDYEMELTGTINEDGDVEGEAIVFVSGWNGDVYEYAGEMEGEGRDDGLDLSWVTDVDLWGNQTEALGEVEAERR